LPGITGSTITFWNPGFIVLRSDTEHPEHAAPATHNAGYSTTLEATVCLLGEISTSHEPRVDQGISRPIQIRGGTKGMPAHTLPLATLLFIDGDYTFTFKRCQGKTLPYKI
jgi:hypothetical protein